MANLPAPLRLHPDKRLKAFEKVLNTNHNTQQDAIMKKNKPLISGIFSRFLGYSFAGNVFVFLILIP
jgi:hypothetical protein